MPDAVPGPPPEGGPPSPGADPTRRVTRPPVPGRLPTGKAPDPTPDRSAPGVAADPPTDQFPQQSPPQRQRTLRFEAPGQAASHGGAFGGGAAPYGAPAYGPPGFGPPGSASGFPPPGYPHPGYGPPPAARPGPPLVGPRRRRRRRWPWLLLTLLAVALVVAGLVVLLQSRGTPIAPAPDTVDRSGLGDPASPDVARDWVAALADGDTDAAYRQLCAAGRDRFSDGTELRADFEDWLGGGVAGGAVAKAVQHGGDDYVTIAVNLDDGRRTGVALLLVREMSRPRVCGYLEPHLVP